MRYRFSVWDAVFALLFVTFIVVGTIALEAAPDAVPLHYGSGGKPTRWGPPTFMNVAGIPLFVLLITYVPVRLVDLFHFAATAPAQYGFATNMAGGLTVLAAIITSPTVTMPLFGTLPGPWFSPILVGLIFVFMGLMFILTPPERLKFNDGGMLADTPEARRIFARSLGVSLMISGIVFVPGAALLRGAWSLLGAVPLIFGPLVGIIVGTAKAPKRARK